MLHTTCVLLYERKTLALQQSHMNVITVSIHPKEKLISTPTQLSKAHENQVWSSVQCERIPFPFNTVVSIRLMQTTYTTSEAVGSVSVCVDLSSAQLARNVSVTLRSVAAGQAVGKSFGYLTHRNHIIYSYTEILPVGYSPFNKIFVCAKVQPLH